MLFSLLGGGTFKGLDMFDVGNAFASAPTRRRVFVQQPPGYWDGSSTVFQLMRAFYGQRDAGRLFWLHLEDVLFKHGWIRSTADPCIWYKGTAKANNLSVLATHVDDILCFFQDKQGAKDLRKNLEDSFERIATTEQPTQAIGMEIEYGDGFVKLHQKSSLTLIAKVPNTLHALRKRGYMVTGVPSLPYLAPLSSSGKTVSEGEVVVLLSAPESSRAFQRWDCRGQSGLLLGSGCSVRVFSSC